MVNFTLCVFYHNKKKIRLNFTTSWACSSENDLSGYVVQPAHVTDEETEVLGNGMTQWRLHSNEQQNQVMTVVFLSLCIRLL